MARLDIIGGGPAGAFTARLAALRYPDWKIRLYERLPPRDTFGFGVGLTRSLLKAVHNADPAVHDRLLQATRPFSSAKFHLEQGTVSFGQFHSGAIRRSELLRLLLESAAEAGAEVEIGTVATVDDLRETADIVVAADGLSSSTRQRLLPAFGATTTMGRGVFIWCAAEITLDGTAFEPVQTADGLFVAHAYPYADGLSTFVIEAGAHTIRRAGFSDRQWSSDSESDDAALAYLSNAFSKLLGGARFFGNRSRWSHFTTLRCENWSHENIVLIGDAAATVHPSLGSGTKVALESAIALVDSFADLADMPPEKVLLNYGRSRKPQVNRLQDRAQRSQLWWESFECRKDLSGPRLALAYLSRAGVVSLDSLAASEPDLAARAVDDFCGTWPDVPAEDISEWVLARPFDSATASLPTRVLPAEPDPTADHVPGVAAIDIASGDAWGPYGDEYLRQAKHCLADGAQIVALTGGDNRGAVMDRLAVAERIRRETSGVIAVRATPEHHNLVADGIVAGRTDLLQLAP